MHYINTFLTWQQHHSLHPPKFNIKWTFVPSWWENLFEDYCIRMHYFQLGAPNDQETSKIINQYKLINYIFDLCNIYIVMNIIFLFAFRCSLTQRWVPVSLNLPSSRQQAPPRRLSLAPPGGGLVCCTCRAVGTSAPSPALRSSPWNIEGTAGKWGRGQALEPVQGQDPAWIILSGLTVWSESLGRRCFEGQPLLLKYGGQQSWMLPYL